MDVGLVVATFNGFATTERQCDVSLCDAGIQWVTALVLLMVGVAGRRSAIARIGLTSSVAQDESSPSANGGRRKAGRELPPGLSQPAPVGRWSLAQITRISWILGVGRVQRGNLLAAALHAACYCDSSDEPSAVNRLTRA